LYADGQQPPNFQSSLRSRRIKLKIFTRNVYSWCQQR